jgi:hypothetical protein
LKQVNQTWTTKTDDLFPYASSPSSYWTGYFTSRANAKSFVRAGSHNLRASNQFYTSVLLDENTPSELADNIMDANSNLLDQMGIY